MASYVTLVLGILSSGILTRLAAAQEQQQQNSITTEVADLLAAVDAVDNNDDDGDDESNEYRNKIGIIAANSYRKIHGVPPLEYDPHLAEHAEGWAEKVLGKIARDGKLKPYYSHPYSEGENVMVLEGPVGPLSLGTAISEWYSEIKNYDFEKNGFTLGTAQFTQLSKVWKETLKIGLGMAHDAEKNLLVIVARFKPVGNTGFHNSFGLNVFPPIANNNDSGHLESSNNPTTVSVTEEPVSQVSTENPTTATTQKTLTTPPTTASSTPVPISKSTRPSAVRILTISIREIFRKPSSSSTTKRPPRTRFIPKATTAATTEVSTKKATDKVETSTQDDFSMTEDDDITESNYFKMSSTMRSEDSSTSDESVATTDEMILTSTDDGTTLQQDTNE